MNLYNKKNIFNKDDAMKKSLLLQISSRRGTSALTVAALFALSGMMVAADANAGKAQGNAKPAPVKTVQTAAKPAQPAGNQKKDNTAKPAVANAKTTANAKPAVKKVEIPGVKEVNDGWATEEKEICRKLQEAEAFANPEKEGNDPFKALKTLSEADKLIIKAGGSPAKPALKKLAEIQKRFKNDLESTRILCGEAKFEAAKRKYEESLAFRATEKGIEAAKEATKLAGEAKLYYYFGVATPSEAEDLAKKQADGNTNLLFDLNDSLKNAKGQQLNVEMATLLKLAINFQNNDFSIRVQNLIDNCEKPASAKQVKDETSVNAVDPFYFEREKQIDELYAKAEKLYRDRKYTQARDFCEKIFVKDPYEQRAMRLLDKIYKKLYFYAELRAYNEMLRIDAETIWSWSPGVSNVGNREQVVSNRSTSDPVMDKLTSLKISVDFVDYDLRSAINKIREKSKEVDPQHVGINFLPIDLGTSGDKTVTLQLDQVPINVVLDYLCKKTGISWTTDKESMVKYGNSIENYEIREIPLRLSVYNSMVSNEEGGEDAAASDKDSVWGKGGIEAGVEANVQKQKKVTDKALKEFFEKRGIKFDDKCTIYYSKSSHRLTVKNTREYLSKLEILAREMDVENPLILIESKMLEISLNDQEELGFDWLLTASTTDGNWDYSMSTPLRDSGLGNNKFINCMNIIPNVKIGGNTRVSLYLTVTAVDRTDRMELLSTPKVVTTNGTEANIKMVQQMYFPESWTEPDTSNVNGTSFEFQPSYPEFGDPTDVGISFTVTPTVSSNNKMITLQLFPSVTELTGWSDYSYDVYMKREPPEEEGANKLLKPMGDNAKAVVGADEDPNPEYETKTSRITLKMPEIAVREVNTNVKVFDGQTMLIGGMVIDRQATMEDRFPILGDIPLIGRLFSKQAYTLERSNLLISVTTRLVSGDGVPCNNNPPNGIPDFRR